ncbi:MAG: methylmalonyl Co-A mutase-associated GTPase MeaB [Opitutaceae bacterium]|nr:methylmalonyl Co-A mutase-associated GTPase MeaB [Opitutaceae bacterium]
MSSLELVPGVLAGKVRAVARLITRAEAGMPECRPALDAIFRHAGRAHIIGITGVPGSGKSALVARIVAVMRQTGRRVGVVAIDPSSPFSGGAILGDRIRMGEITADTGVFVRSMATRGALGGLARGTLEAVDVLDAAGYDVVVIETVGVGQDEVDVARAAHTTIVVSAPGLGDDIQAIKAGILEIADIHVVSKCDRSDADKTVADLKNMLAMGLTFARPSSWLPPLVPTSAPRCAGIAELVATIDRHWTFLRDSGEINDRRRRINERRLLKAGEEILRARFVHDRDARLAQLLEQLQAHALSPHAAAQRLLEDIQIGDKS